MKTKTCRKQAAWMLWYQCFLCLGSIIGHGFSFVFRSGKERDRAVWRHLTGMVWRIDIICFCSVQKELLSSTLIPSVRATETAIDSVISFILCLRVQHVLIFCQEYDEIFLYETLGFSCNLFWKINKSVRLVQSFNCAMLQ